MADCELQTNIQHKDGVNLKCPFLVLENSRCGEENVQPIVLYFLLYNCTARLTC